MFPKARKVGVEWEQLAVGCKSKSASLLETSIPLSDGVPSDFTFFAKQLADSPDSFLLRLRFLVNSKLELDEFEDSFTVVTIPVGILRCFETRLFLEDLDFISSSEAVEEPDEEEEEEEEEEDDDVDDK